VSIPVAITGVGAISAVGVGADVLHMRTIAGGTGLEDGLGLCRDFTPSDFLSKREMRRTDRFSQFALAAAEEALSQAGWGSGPPCDPASVTCVIGSGLGGIESFEKQLSAPGEVGPDDVSPLLIPMMMPNAAAANIAIRYGLQGQSYCLVSACSGGAQAIGAGIQAIRNGDAMAAVVGGSEAATSAIVQAAFRNAGTLSPSGHSVPFDSKRDGFILGEGAGVLVLENAKLATERGASVLAELRGYGASTDAHHITAPEPTGKMAAEAVRRALSDAEFTPDDIGYINAHGTGTILNDQTEVHALREVFGDALRKVPISSSKSHVGHLLGAAGAVEAVAVVQALRYGVAPPTVGLREPDPALGDLDHVMNARSLVHRSDSRSALSTSFGFGGHNAALVFGPASHQYVAA
jgi:3-oxoacyl-[acyl-carrier-protein] synthase II